jgi:hypothetical protein
MLSNCHTVITCHMLFSAVPFVGADSVVQAPLLAMTPAGKDKNCEVVEDEEEEEEDEEGRGHCSSDMFRVLTSHQRSLVLGRPFCHQQREYQEHEEQVLLQDLMVHLQAIESFLQDGEGRQQLAVCGVESRDGSKVAMELGLNVG